MIPPEIVVGACYQDMADGEVVRALTSEPEAHGYQCAVVVPLGDRDDSYIGQRIWCDLLAGQWRRVPDPTPAVVEDEADHEREADASFALQEVARLRAQIRTLTAEVAKAEERGARWALVAGMLECDKREPMALRLAESDAARICAEARAKGGE